MTKLTNTQKLYNKKYGTRNTSGSPRQLKSDFPSLEKNPVIDFNLKANGGEFKTTTGGKYQKGNPLYDKYNGEYHIHLNGEICAGYHKINVMNPHNILTAADSHLGHNNNNLIRTRKQNRINKLRRRPRVRNRV